jgi:hypothetical protein
MRIVNQGFADKYDIYEDDNGVLRYGRLRNRSKYSFLEIAQHPLGSPIISMETPKVAIPKLRFHYQGETPENTVKTLLPIPPMEWDKYEKFSIKSKNKFKVYRHPKKRQKESRKAKKTKSGLNASDYKIIEDSDFIYESDDDDWDDKYDNVDYLFFLYE